MPVCRTPSPPPLTDVHSRVAGHGAHEPGLDANYGDVLSFYERLKEMFPDKDIFFVMTGDFLDGTGIASYRRLLIPLPFCDSCHGMR